MGNRSLTLRAGLVPSFMYGWVSGMVTEPACFAGPFAGLGADLLKEGIGLISFVHADEACQIRAG